MSTATTLHTTVLLAEAVAALAIEGERRSGFYADGTFGRGGHADLILQSLSNDGELLAFDKDPQAIAAAEQRFGNDERFSIVHESFADMLVVLNRRQSQNKRRQLDGVLLDLGVSSPQLNEAERGFSFLRDGPLDMRMDPTRGESVAQWLVDSDRDMIAKVLREYGEEKFAWRIAGAIREHIEAGLRLDTTLQLADLIEKNVPAASRRKEKKHVATRSFQALRIAVNHELDDLAVVLQAAVEQLAIGGRLVVISFHSLEDRMVKRFMQAESKPDVPKNLPMAGDWQGRLKLLSRAVKPSADEIDLNPRARSAVMRVAERVEPCLPGSSGMLQSSDPGFVTRGLTSRDQKSRRQA